MNQASLKYYDHAEMRSNPPTLLSKNQPFTQKLWFHRVKAYEQNRCAKREGAGWKLYGLTTAKYEDFITIAGVVA